MEPYLPRPTFDSTQLLQKLLDRKGNLEIDEVVELVTMDACLTHRTLQLAVKTDGDSISDAIAGVIRRYGISYVETLVIGNILMSAMIGVTGFMLKREAKPLDPSLCSISPNRSFLGEISLSGKVFSLCYVYMPAEVFENSLGISYESNDLQNETFPNRSVGYFQEFLNIFCIRLKCDLFLSGIHVDVRRPVVYDSAKLPSLGNVSWARYNAFAFSIGGDFLWVDFYCSPLR